MYLEPIWKSQQILYRFYKEVCKKENINPLSAASFSTVFSEKNYTLFHPKNDQCNTCLSFKCGNVSEDIYKEHIKKKEEGRKEQSKDKEEGKWVFSMDLQSVLMAPLTNASAMYSCGRNNSSG